jgi:hypothetical protein
LQDPPKFAQIGIFGLKICHLATLVVAALPAGAGLIHKHQLALASEARPKKASSFLLRTFLQLLEQKCFF